MGIPVVDLGERARVRRDAFDRQIRILELARRQWRQLSQRRDELILAQLVQASLEAIAQQRCERLTLPHAEVTARRFVLVPLLELEPELARWRTHSRLPLGSA